MQPIRIRFPFRPRTLSLACGEVAALFGIGGDEPDHVIADDVELDIRPGDVVLFSGPSGSGKSSLLRAAGQQLAALDAGAIECPDLPLVDCLDGPVPDRLERLTACGLGEARLLLRCPAELSDGQRARLRLALAVARQPRFVLADEFGAVLDRTLAKVIARNVRKLATRHKMGFLVATTHDDLTDDLHPDLHVIVRGDGEITAIRCDPEKKTPVSSQSFGSRKAPAPTGRTSLGGITAGTGSAS